LKRIKETYNKILAKQANTIPDPPPSYHPFSISWAEEDLPPFCINPDSASKLAERSCAWLLAHNGFDGSDFLICSCMSIRIVGIGRFAK
jgi:hypothetical protein